MTHMLVSLRVETFCGAEKSDLKARERLEMNCLKDRVMEAPGSSFLKYWAMT